MFLFLSENGVDAVILGGRKKEPPYLLGGRETETSAMNYYADKAFFSTYSVSAQGFISAEPEFETLRKIMISNSKKSYYLISEDKMFREFKRSLCNFGEISGVVSDCVFGEATRLRYPDTDFIIATKSDN